MIFNIIPAHVEAAEAVEDDHADSLLFEEEAALGRVVEGRRREFTTGRTCARRALAKLGFPASAIIPGPNREPIWPEGVVGSITHCAGYRAAAVARREDFYSLGIDAEPHDTLPKGVLRKVALAEELNWLRMMSDSDIYWDRVLFSAKESVYKTWFPVARRWLGFHDALVHFDVPLGTFHATLLIEGPTVNGERIQAVAGRFCIESGLVKTFAAIATDRSVALS